MVYGISMNILFPLAKLWMKDIGRLEYIPKEGGFVIAANHSSYLDDFSVAPIVTIHIKKHVHMYCNDRFYKNKVFAAFLTWCECIPISIETQNKATNKKALKLALRYLRKNEPVGIFPEGGRSPDGKLMKAKTGVAKLALLSKSPVLPVGIIGSYNVFPKGAKFPKFKRFSMKIGKPIHLDKYFGKQDNKKVLKEVTTLIMKEIAKLTNLRYEY